MASSPSHDLNRVRAAARADSEVNFGFWAYLMSDVVLFSMLFLAYVNLSQRYAGGPTPGDIFSLHGVFLETMALLASSLTFGLAMVSLHQGKKNHIIGWLLATFLLGGFFLWHEVSEFVHIIHEGASFDRSGFLSAYFGLVGTHGAHVFFGMIWLLTMVAQVALRGLTPAIGSRLARLSLFWHFLDLVWICVFSTVYLPGLIQGGSA
ncbi:cytochrome o ubiquinol oxidase subunit III [uncultured Salinisphaera sp.]|jgi:cytochrome o ubiquinol oxidase subunit 3|uniref:cytochrome o ubiquinol oxidase subunit III n=1 Tax=uncultured Salinisphaera sp. TaxID=359372 RepID=UPI0032B10423|tara:strand:- start:531 stop:1151 length:621 start_codon:yes stop_codon:yes gene_type:complete